MVVEYRKTDRKDRQGGQTGRTDRNDRQGGQIGRTDKKDRQEGQTVRTERKDRKEGQTLTGRTSRPAHRRHSEMCSRVIRAFSGVSKTSYQNR